MKIHGITVSVGYADMLRKTLPRWIDSLNTIVVATSEQDSQTRAISREFARTNLAVFATDAFYRNGASFNKGAAINEIYRSTSIKNPETGMLENPDWILLFDADVCPMHDGWRSRIERQIVSGNLYGAPRFDAETIAAFNDPDVAGYFMLFNAADPHALDADGNLVDVCWPHAGNYDTTFHRRWAANQKIILRDLPLLHYGETGKNWWGIGNDDKMRAMNEERIRRGGWEHERMEKP